MNQAVSVLGATGSIGTQTLDVCEKLNIPVCAIAAGRDAAALELQARKFGVKLAVLNDKAAARDLKTRLADTSVRVASGMEGLCEAAAMEEAETVVTAVVGTVGLLPTMDAIRAKKRIALALYIIPCNFSTQLGDLAFSAIKREVGIKDFGKVLPGHGGMLDRFDSQIFTMPMLYLLMSLVPAFG